jgi:hypothetical protein
MKKHSFYPRWAIKDADGWLLNAVEMGLHPFQQARFMVFHKKYSPITIITSAPFIDSIYDDGMRAEAWEITKKKWPKRCLEYFYKQKK